jgi:hypothetical protein
MKPFNEGGMMRKGLAAIIAALITSSGSVVRSRYWMAESATWPQAISRSQSLSG